MGRVLEIVLLVVAFVSFGLTLLANYLFGLGTELFGLNFTSVGDVSDIYSTNITPSGWTFSIWAVIYLWQGVLLVYFATLMCRKTEDAMPMTPIVSNVAVFYGLYLANFASNIIWIFLWCLEYVEYAMLFISLLAIFLWCALASAVYGLSRDAQYLADQDKKIDVWLNIICVQNGICIYATWVTIATMINLNIVLVYEAGLSMVDGSTIAIFCVAAALMVWFIVETFVCDKTCRYCFTPYLVVMFAISGSIDKNWQTGSANSIISAFLIALAGVFLITKIVLAVIGEMKNPLYVTGNMKSNKVEANESYLTSQSEMEKL